MCRIVRVTRGLLILLSALAIFGTIAFIQKLEAPKFSSFGGNNSIIAATCNHSYLQLIKLNLNQEIIDKFLFFKSFIEQFVLPSAFCSNSTEITVKTVVSWKIRLLNSKIKVYTPE